MGTASRGMSSRRSRLNEHLFQCCQIYFYWCWTFSHTDGHRSTSQRSAVGQKHNSLTLCEANAFFVKAIPSPEYSACSYFPIRGLVAVCFKFGLARCLVSHVETIMFLTIPLNRNCHDMLYMVINPWRPKTIKQKHGSWQWDNGHWQGETEKRHVPHSQDRKSWHHCNFGQPKFITSYNHVPDTKIFERIAVEPDKYKIRETNSFMAGFLCKMLHKGGWKFMPWG